MIDARVLCLYGRDEPDSPCPTLEGPAVRVVGLDGGHHFNGDYGALVRHIAEFANSVAGGAGGSAVRTPGDGG